MSKTFDELYAVVTVQILPGRRIKVFGAGTDADWTAAIESEIRHLLDDVLRADMVGGWYLGDDGRLMTEPLDGLPTAVA
jgi:hypothetical protein